MAIQTRNKRDVSFNFSSMSDLVFLLLIFFVLTSTLIAPNAIKLLLPSSDSKTMANAQVVQVSINSDNEYFVDSEEVPVSLQELRLRLQSGLKGQEEASVVVRSDQNVGIQYVVNVIDIVNDINNKQNTIHKVILATRPK
ncbi:MAG: biopolymer transporter ExbD [Bacteroidales bacterium]